MTRLLRGTRAKYGDNHPAAAQVWQEFGKLHVDRNEPRRAEAAFLAAERVWQRLPEHVSDWVRCQLSRAELYARFGRFRSARELAQRLDALGIGATQGPKLELRFRRIRAAVAGLAGDARVLVRERRAVVALTKRLYHRDADARVLRAELALATALDAVGEPRAALQLGGALTSRAQRSLAMDSWLRYLIVSEHVCQLLRRKAFLSARTLLAQLLVVARQAGLSERTDIPCWAEADVLLWQGRCALGLKLYDEAERQIRASLRVIQQVSDSRVATGRRNLWLARVQAARGERSHAIRSYERAIAGISTVLSAYSGLYEQGYHELAALYDVAATARLTRESIARFRHCLVALRAYRGPYSEERLAHDVRVTEVRLARFLRIAGRYEEAARLLSSAKVALTSERGPRSKWAVLSCEELAKLHKLAPSLSEVR